LSSGGVDPQHFLAKLTSLCRRKNPAIPKVGKTTKIGTNVKMYFFDLKKVCNKVRK
jgi:hypothetical protein